jgi:hypothetical protein
MNELSPNNTDLEADSQLTADLKTILSEIGAVVPDEAYEPTDIEGGETVLSLKSAPEAEVDEETLNKKWKEAYVLLRQAFRQGLRQSQWQEIL